MNSTPSSGSSTLTGNFSCNFLIFCGNGKFSTTIFIFIDQLLAIGWWISYKGRRATGTGDSGASNLGGSCAADVGELQ